MKNSVSFLFFFIYIWILLLWRRMCEAIQSSSFISCSTPICGVHEILAFTVWRRNILDLFAFVLLYLQAGKSITGISFLEQQNLWRLSSIKVLRHIISIWGALVVYHDDAGDKNYQRSSTSRPFLPNIDENMIFVV